MHGIRVRRGGVSIWVRSIMGIFDFLEPPEKPTHCAVIEGWFPLLVQVVLGLIAFSSLIIKRFLEKPRRPWIIWGMDVSKQIVSSLAAHSMGIISSLIMSHITESDSECAWYLVTFFIDTTLGMAVSISLMKLAALFALKSQLWFLSYLAHPGFYGPVSLDWKQKQTYIFLGAWASQTAVWALFTLVGRVVCLITVIVLSPLLIVVADWIAYPFNGHPDIFLVVVMLAAPLGMNTIQFVVQDVFLKLTVKKKNLPTDEEPMVGVKDVSIDHVLEMGEADDLEQGDREREMSHDDRADSESSLLLEKGNVISVRISPR